MDELQNKIKAIYQVSKTYPDLVHALIRLGIQSYTVDVATGITLYRLEGGKSSLHSSELAQRVVEAEFNKELTVQAVKTTQQGKSTYPEFMNEIAKAGVRFYEATLNGNQKRVTYIGSGGSYEELIPF
ncbi:DUF1398 family protein [Aurantibacillus circumpalustris]|uniref:DUF1398 family protein n=1 Tax=Aurantibacillus circumpalustris TaxID=3036359 RepID=UPI00295A89B3|nr:DUF1398 family protein [Aurantibacillus circumpalustris]